MGLRLYEIAERYRAIDAALDESGGDLTPETEAELAAIDDAMEAKVDAIGGLIQEATREASAYSSEITRLMIRRRVAENKAASLRRTLRDGIVASGRAKVKGDRFSARPANASRPSIAWERDPQDLPMDFQRVTVEVDGDAAFKAFKAGTLPAGFAVRFTEYLDLR